MSGHPSSTASPPRPAPQPGSRLIAAVLGGYLLAAALSAFLALALPIRQMDAVTIGMQASFVVYTAAVIWAFSPVSVSRVWVGLMAPAVVLGALGWALR